MVRLLGLLVAVLIVFAVIGYFRGWFHANVHNVNGQNTVTLTVDQEKLNQDKARAEQRLRDLEPK
jgi:hypothetical protein